MNTYQISKRFLMIIEDTGYLMYLYELPDAKVITSNIVLVVKG